MFQMYYSEHQGNIKAANGVIPFRDPRLRSRRGRARRGRVHRPGCTPARRAGSSELPACDHGEAGLGEAVPRLAEPGLGLSACNHVEAGLGEPGYIGEAVPRLAEPGRETPGLRSWRGRARRRCTPARRAGSFRFSACNHGEAGLASRVHWPGCAPARRAGSYKLPACDHGEAGLGEPGYIGPAVPRLAEPGLRTPGLRSRRGRARRPGYIGRLYPGSPSRVLVRRPACNRGEAGLGEPG